MGRRRGRHWLSGQGVDRVERDEDMQISILGMNGPFPGPEGATSGYLLESDSGQTRVLLECGSGVLGRLSAIMPPCELSGIVVSHLHYDHMADLLPLQYALQFQPPRRNIPLYAPESPTQVRALLECPWLDLYPARDARIGEMSFRFIPANHPVESVCVAVECDGARMVFTGDTNENPLLELFADGADLLLADAGLDDDVWKPLSPHLSAGMCGRLAAACRARRLLLTHLNPLADQDKLLEQARRSFPGAEIARQGQWYAI